MATWDFFNACNYIHTYIAMNITCDSSFLMQERIVVVIEIAEKEMYLAVMIDDYAAMYTNSQLITVHRMQ